MVHRAYYADDCITGIDNTEDAISLHGQLNALHSKGCMHLRKCRTNDQRVREAIPKEFQESKPLLIEAPTEQHKALCLHWDITLDTLHVAAPQLRQVIELTKRLILLKTLTCSDGLRLLQWPSRCSYDGCGSSRLAGMSKFQNTSLNSSMPGEQNSTS